MKIKAEQVEVGNVIWDILNRRAAKVVKVSRGCGTTFISVEGGEENIQKHGCGQAMHFDREDSIHRFTEKEA